jgi:hypothetical protein
MALDLTQEQIDAYHAERARLEPIAQLCGVAFDDQNYQLMRALGTIEYERRGGTKGPAAVKDAAPGSLTAQAQQASQNFRQAKAGAPQANAGAKDIGDLVADRIAPVAAATRPTEAARAATDIGDLVADRIAPLPVARAAQPKDLADHVADAVLSRTAGGVKSW